MSNFMHWILRHHKLRVLFALAVVGQSLVLGIGLWLEQQLLDSTESMAVAQLGSQPGGVVGAVSSADATMAAAELSQWIKITAFIWISCSQAAIAYLILSRWHATKLQQQNADQRLFAQQNHDLLRTRDAVIFGLAKLAESRDPDTGHHLERIALYSTRLAEALKRHHRFQDEITPGFLKLLGVSSALHDIGKVGVEDAILLKPGRLTDTERLKIQQHTMFGGRCIEQIESRLGVSNFLSMAREIALYHHERWDGSGYPYGLKHTEIPLAARIVAVADVYDALSVRRVYKEPFPHEKCVALIGEGAGTQFDPLIVEVFLQIEADFRRYALELSDISDECDASCDPVAMNAEQERLIERVINAEKFCRRDAALVEVTPV